MATHKDAMKRHRQNQKRNERNSYYKSSMRTLTKKFRAALESGDVQGAEVLFSQSTKLIQKIAQKGVIHKNQAARRVSRLHKALNKAKA